MQYIQYYLNQFIEYLLSFDYSECVIRSYRYLLIIFLPTQMQCAGIWKETNSFEQNRE